jgi:hypothetical protein
MVDDQPDHLARSSTTDPQHACGRRADHPQDLHYHAAILVDRQRLQGAIAPQPVCGYVLDVLGLKIGFAIFAVAWSLVNMAHGP